MKVRLAKGRGGKSVDATAFNTLVNDIQDKLNAIESDQFRYSIDRDRFVTNPLKRTDVSSRGGASKVLELSGVEDLRIKCVDSGSTVTIGTALAYIQFDLSNREFRFYADSVLATKLGYAGWTITP